MNLTPQRGRHEFVAAAIAVAIYAGLGSAVALSPEPEPTQEEEPDAVDVDTFVADIKLKKPEPPKPKVEEEVVPPEPAKPEPLPELKPLEELKPPAKPEEIKPIEPQAAPKKPPRAKRKSNRKANRKKPKAGPKTVVITTAMSGTNGPRAHQGDDDVFGSPEVAPTESSKEPDESPRGDGPKESKGTAPTGAATPEPGPPPKFVAPTVIQKIKGRYPDDAPRTGRVINVILSLRIDEAGKVDSARIVTKPTRAGTFFDSEALRVARRTRFKPATKGGKPVPHTIRYTVSFTP